MPLPASTVLFLVCDPVQSRHVNCTRAPNSPLPNTPNSRHWLWPRRPPLVPLQQHRRRPGADSSRSLESHPTTRDHNRPSHQEHPPKQYLHHPIHHHQYGLPRGDAWRTQHPHKVQRTTLPCPPHDPTRRMLCRRDVMTCKSFTLLQAMPIAQQRVHVKSKMWNASRRHHGIGARRTP